MNRGLFFVVSVFVAILVLAGGAGIGVGISSAVGGGSSPPGHLSHPGKNSSPGQLSHPGKTGTGCPSDGGWFLASTAVYIGALDNGNVQDQNGDGLACYRVNAGQTDKNGPPSYTWKDNTNP